MTFCIALAAIFSLFGVLLILPQMVEICTISNKLLENKKGHYRTSKSIKESRYCYLLWFSQTFLGIRFGEQLTFNQHTIKELF